MKCNKKDEVLVSFILHTFTNMSVICWDWQWSSYPCDFEMLRCGTITCSIPIHSCTTFDEGLLCYHYKYLWSFFYWICPKSEQKTKNMAAKLLLFSSSISFEDTVSRPLDIYIYRSVFLTSIWTYCSHSTTSIWNCAEVVCHASVEPKKYTDDLLISPF